MLIVQYLNDKLSSKNDAITQPKIKKYNDQIC